MTAEPRRTLRSHSAAEPQLNEVGFEEPPVWSEQHWLGFPRPSSVSVEVSELSLYGDRDIFIEAKLNLVHANRHLSEFASVQEA